MGDRSSRPVRRDLAWFTLEPNLVGTNDVKLSFDEWNVWYHFQEAGVVPEKWICPRPIEEEEYTFADALLVGSMLTTLINNSDTVKIACLAQLVNVIAPIMTVPGGGSWLQTIYYPFLHTSLHGRGTALRTDMECPAYSCQIGDSIPIVDCAAVLSHDETELNLFLVNKDTKNAMESQVILEDLRTSGTVEHHTMSAPLDARNTADRTEVKPGRAVGAECRDQEIKFTMEPASWNWVRVPLI